MMIVVKVILIKNNDGWEQIVRIIIINEKSNNVIDIIVEMINNKYIKEQEGKKLYLSLIKL